MKNSFILTLLILSMSACAQYNNFDEMATKMADGDVPTIKADALYKSINQNKKLYILDARAIEEYNVSHLKNALFVGYDNFEEKSVSSIPKYAEIVVYCSVGYRSCKIGEKLQDLGYKNVVNLYGGIFDWINNELPLVDNDGNPTKKVHAYNEDWGKWVMKGIKVY